MRRTSLRGSRRGTARSCRGFTLIELVVALAVGGAIFGAFTLVVAQQERAHAELARRVRSRAQLRDGLAALAADLRTISPTAGDIAAGEARDSSIQLRATIGTAVACEVRDQVVVLALASFVGPPEPGDTAWAYVHSAGGGGWTPLPIERLSLLDADAPAACPFPVAALSAREPAPRARTRYAFSVSGELDAAVVVGTPLRVTRPARYSLYHAPDGGWYLGRREWSAARNRFETIQPVSGPYRAYAHPETDASGIELRYFDPAGVEVPSGSLDTERIALLAISLRAPPSALRGALTERRDVATVAVAVRDRP